MLGDDVALLAERPEHRLQPSARGAMPLGASKHLAHGISVRLERRFNQLILGLEVVVDVPQRNIRPRRDIGERRAIDPLLVEHGLRALDQSLPLPGPTPDCLRLLHDSTVA